MDITLIVPTMNRSGFIIRLLRYYHESNFKGRIIIGDSSGLEHALPTKAEIDKLKHTLAIEYLECPGLDTNATFIKLNSMVRTKYIAYLGDDDFLVPAGIEKCIQFLEKNPNYSAAHGNARVFRMQSGAAHGKLKVGVPYYQRGIEYDSPSDRLGSHLADYSVTIFSVHRTDDWQIMWKDLNRVADRAFGAELLPCCLSVILGKIKHLKCLYLLRQTHDQIYHLPTFYDWVTSPEWNSSYQIFKNVLANQLSLKEGISYPEAEKTVKNAFNRYLFGNQKLTWSEKFWRSVDPTLVRLGEKFPSAKPFGKWLRNLVGNMINSPRYAIDKFKFLRKFIWTFLSTSLALSFRKDMQDVYSSIKKNKAIMKKILLVIFGPTDGTEIIRLAQQLKLSGRFTPVVFFHGNYTTLSERLDYSLLDQIECHDARGFIRSSISYSGSPAVQSDEVFPGNKATVSRQILNRMPLKMKIALRAIVYAVYRPISSLRSKLNRLWYHLLRLSIIGNILSLKNQLREITCLLKSIAPDILILPLESIGHYSATFAKAAYDMGIPTTIVPYTVPVNVLEITERWYFDASYHLSNPINRFIAKIYPQWVYEYKGQKLLRLLPAQIVATKWLGLAPADPWKAGGLKYSRAIAVENTSMLEYYLREGFEKEILFVTGALVDDILSDGLPSADERRRKLYQELGLRDDKPLLLSSMPPDFVSREVCDFQTFPALVQFWIKSLANIENYNVVIRLHPSLSYNELKYIEQWGVKITQKDTAYLIPLCDLFVTAVSATIRWAIACGKPVINYDVFRFGYTDYNEAGGVLTMDDRKTYLETLRRITSDPEYYQSVSIRQRKCMRRWGNLDVHTADRMFDLFDNLNFTKKEHECSVKSMSRFLL